MTKPTPLYQVTGPDAATRLYDNLPEAQEARFRAFQTNGHAHGIRTIRDENGKAV